MNKATFLLVILAIGLVAATEHVEENNAADQLVREVQHLENSIRDEQTSHQELWDSQSEQCTADIGFRNQEVSDAVDALANSADSQNRLEKALASSTYDQAKAQQYVDDINTILSNLHIQRETEHAHFLDVVNNQLTPAIDAINGVFPLLQELSEGADSFVQLTNHISKSFVQMIKLRRGAQFGAIYAQLLSAQTVGVSEDTIEQLSRLFDDLVEDLTTEKEQRIANEKAAQDLYDETVANYNSILATLGVTLQTLADYIVELNASIQTEHSVSASAEAKRQRNQDALDHAVALCDSLQQDFDNQTAGREKELALLQKLKTFVRQQEGIFGNFGVDEVDAYGDFQKSFAETRSASRSNFLQVALKKFNHGANKPVASAKCESCKKAFIQKKLGF